MVDQQFPIDLHEKVDRWDQEELADNKIGSEAEARLRHINIKLFAGGGSAEYPERIADKAPQEKWDGSKNDRQIREAVGDEEVVGRKRAEGE